MSSLASALRLSNQVVFGTIAVTLYQTKAFNLFALHPILMTMAYYYVCEAVISLATSKQVLSRVQSHQKQQMFAAFLAMVGFTIIYLIKDWANKLHFQTYHGLLGSIVATTLIVTTIFSTFMFQRYSLSAKLFWFLHGLNGSISVIALWTTLWLHYGAPNGWFDHNSRIFRQAIPLGGKAALVR
ncbi:hypothetical protein HDV04_003677 [Boothiomyces sp. JEL0838]|nr:hypothetical protein HDV04_003677 [Boothiomyces sp. JEL0838]